MDVPVSYMDAYYEFAERPRIAEACDVILANCYPFWEGCDMDYQGYVSKGCTCRKWKKGDHLRNGLAKPGHQPGWGLSFLRKLPEVL